MMKVLTSLIGILSFLTWQSSYASPAISSVSGSFQQGETITITGSSFGMGDSTPLVWDDFENGTLGSSINSSPQIGSWQCNSPGQATYVNTTRHSGQKSLYGIRSPSAQWTNFNVEMPDSQKFYASFWFRYNYSTGGMGQTKLFQIHGTYGVGDYNPGVMTGGMAGDWWASYIALENTGVYARTNYPSDPVQEPPHDTWHLIEFIGKQSTPNVADGIVQIKLNGKLVYNLPATKTRELSGQRWSLFTFFTGMTNFTSETFTWIDDAYMNNSWSRVELCDQSLYANCKTRDVQPVSSWSGSSISVRVNAGNFVAGQTVYLYVVDENDAVNSLGYPVMIGSVSNPPPETEPLAAPTNLRLISVSSF